MLKWEALSQIQSSLDTNVVFFDASDIFVVDSNIRDQSVAAFIAQGFLDIALLPSEDAAHAFSALHGPESLYFNLVVAACDRQRLAPRTRRVPHGDEVRAYCWGVFRHPNSDRLSVIVGRELPKLTWNSPALVRAAVDATTAHANEVKNFDEKIKELRNKESDISVQPNQFLSHPLEMAMALSDRPILTAEGLQDLIPIGIAFTIPSLGRKRLLNAITSHIARSGIAPSREGSYASFVPTTPHRQRRGVVSWMPYDGPTSYPELRATLRKVLPSAFHKPIRNDTAPPSHASLEYLSSTTSLPDDTTTLLETLSELHFDYDIDTIKSFKNKIYEEGFEALAWYQSHHIWNEDSWGIYFDSVKIDLLAYSIHTDSMQGSRPLSLGLSAILALGIIDAHEMFHARVDAACSWIELTSLRPTFLKYNKNVYDATRYTSDWLEEALANWNAWEWFQSVPVQRSIRRLGIKDLNPLVRSLLDRSPPGYRDWATGEYRSTWRRFSTQMIRGSSDTRYRMNHLPSDGIMRHYSPYDLRRSDIPTRFVGSGHIADALLKNPAIFNTPSLQEMEKALIYFGYIKYPSKGKGSHEKWMKPHMRSFPLPRRDPVSGAVFREFLDHVSIDKRTYVQSVRPNL